MAEAAMFRAGMRVIGMSVPEFARHFGYPISTVRTWKRRGCPDDVMHYMGMFHMQMFRDDATSMRMPDGSRWALAFMREHGQCEVRS